MDTLVCHFLIFLFPLAIFLYFCIIGKAFLLIVQFPKASLRSWLISPVLGFSLQILIVSIINQAGYPIEKFGRWEGIVILLLAIAIFLWKRPVFNLRLLAPFIISSLIVLAYTGFPLLKFGWEWLSYCNDDMANYCLAAKRFLHHGFFEVPTLEELTGSDYSQRYWFLYVRNFSRYGSELLLASVASVSGKNPLVMFMSTIVALGMTVPPAVAGLVRASHSKYKVMVFASCLLSLSPLFFLGIFYQLIAQIAGVALLCAAATLLMQEKFLWNRRSILQQAPVLGTLGAALAVTYPEITPFFGFGFLLWVAIKSILTNFFFWRPLVLGWWSGVVAILWMRYNVSVYLVTLASQIQHGTSTMDGNVLFPYFLVPSGIPVLLGFSAIADQLSKIEECWRFVLAACILILLIGAVIYSIRQGRGAGCIAAVMIGMGGWLFYKELGFGLFKLAMFIQPFLAIELALLLCSLRLLPSLVGVAIYCGLQIPAAFFYAKSSLGEVNRSFVEIPGISGSNLEIQDTPSNHLLSLRSEHAVVKKFLACLVAQPDQVLNINFHFEAIGISSLCFEKWIRRFHPYAKDIFLVQDLLSEYQARFHRQQIFDTTIIECKKEQLANDKVIRHRSDIEAFNGLSSPSDPDKKSYFFQPERFYPDELYLAFVASSEGAHYYDALNRKKISFYQKQKDFYCSKKSMIGIGRYFLFRVDPPPPEFYLRVAITKSFFGDERTKLLQHAVVKGSHEIPAGFKGDGAANIFVGPITPLVVNRVNYIALDFGEDGQLPQKDTSGIMGLFRKDFVVDPRYLIGYARDISAVTAHRYQTMERPRELKDFPKDIVEATTLEFSGWYEDGYISQHSYVILGPKKKGEDLVLQGLVSGTGKFLSEEQKITVLINGSNVCDQQKIKPGDFEFTLHLPDDKKKNVPTRIDIEFSGVEKLPAPDNRPVSAKISYLGFYTSHK